MPQFINYYELLKINSDASPEEIAKAYKKEFKEWQARQTSASDEEVRQEVSYMMENLPKARQVLLDPEQRKQHDRDIVDFDRRTLEPQDTQNTTNCDELIENGWKLLRIGQLKEALQIATQATNSFGNNPETWYLLAEAKFKNGQTEQSIYEYGRAIALNERDARYHFGLCLVYRSIARNIEALSELEKAVRYDPNTLSYQFSLMETYHELKMYEKSIPILEKLEKHGNNEPANEEISKILKILKQRSFSGNHKLGIGGGLSWGLIGMLMFSPQGIIFLQGIGFLLIPLYYLAARPRQYQISKRIAGISPDLYVTYQQTEGLGKFLALLVFPFFILSDFIDNYLLDRVGASFPNPIRTIINLILKINFQIIILVIVSGIILSILVKTVVNYIYPDPVSTRLSKIDEDFKKCLRQFAGQKITKGLSCYQKTSQQLDAEMMNIEQQILDKLNNQKEKDNFTLQQKTWKQSTSKNLDVIEGRISKRSDKELILKNQQVEMTQKRIEFIRDRANKQNFSIK